MNLQEVLAFSNQKLFDELKKRGANVGPVTDGTKKIYASKLLKLMEQNSEVSQTSELKVKTKKKSKKRQSMQPLKANLDELQENEVTVSDNTEQAPVVQQSVKTTKKAKRRSVARKTVAVEEPVEEVVEENIVTEQVEVVPVEENTVTENVEVVPVDNGGLAAGEPEVVESPTVLTTTKPLVSTWKKTDISSVSRAEMLQSALRRRRPLYENDVQVKSPAVFKTQESQGNKPKKTGISFCALLFIITIVSVLAWVVYSMMEQNPSALELL